jgi:hypothetical protein
MSSESVINPQHYKNGQIECIDAIKAATVHKPAFEAVLVGHVFRYLWRYESKGRIDDVKKARWYVERLVDTVGFEESGFVKPVAADALRWIAIDLNSDVLAQAADQIDVANILLAECVKHVPADLAKRIKEAVQ